MAAPFHGLDHVDTEDLKSRGFTVTYCPGPLSAVALAESAIMLMLSRRFNEARQKFDAAIMYALMGEELSSKTLAIVGFGASGQQLALRAKSFGMRVRAVDVRHIDQTIVDEIQPEFLGGPDDLDDLLCECDYLAVHVPPDRRDPTPHRRSPQLLFQGIPSSRRNRNSESLYR